MAMHTGIGVSKILVLAGAGYTTTILLKNNKLSDLLGELQSLVKGLEKPGDQSEGDSDYADAVAAQGHLVAGLGWALVSVSPIGFEADSFSQVRRLAAEVRQLASSRQNGQITVLNGGSGYGNLSSLILPAAAVGGLGYAYMWWKGIAFSDLMYVTKQNMASAVTNLNKHLENVTDALAKTKKHLTQKIQHLDDKVLEQNELSRDIKADVRGAQQTLDGMEASLGGIQDVVYGLHDKIRSLETKHDVTNRGVMYLCNFVEGKKAFRPEQLKLEQTKSSGKPLLLPYTAAGLKYFQAEVSVTLKKLSSNAVSAVQDRIESLEEDPKLQRSASTMC